VEVNSWHPLLLGMGVGFHLGESCQGYSSYSAWELKKLTTHCIAFHYFHYFHFRQQQQTTTNHHLRSLQLSTSTLVHLVVDLETNTDHGNLCSQCYLLHYIWLVVHLETDWDLPTNTDHGNLHGSLRYLLHYRIPLPWPTLRSSSLVNPPRLLIYLWTYQPWPNSSRSCYDSPITQWQGITQWEAVHGYHSVRWLLPVKLWGMPCICKRRGVHGYHSGRWLLWPVKLWRMPCISNPTISLFLFSRFRCVSVVVVLPLW